MLHVHTFLFMRNTDSINTTKLIGTIQASKVYANDLRPPYKAVRRLRGDAGEQKNVPVTRKDGQACSSQQEVLQRWCKHYSEALNHPKAPAFG